MYANNNPINFVDPSGEASKAQNLGATVLNGILSAINFGIKVASFTKTAAGSIIKAGASLKTDLLVNGIGNSIAFLLVSGQFTEARRNKGNLTVWDGTFERIVDTLGLLNYIPKIDIPVIGSLFSLTNYRLIGLESQNVVPKLSGNWLAVANKFKFIPLNLELSISASDVRVVSTARTGVPQKSDLSGVYARFAITTSAVVAGGGARASEFHFKMGQGYGWKKSTAASFRPVAIGLKVAGEVGSSFPLPGAAPRRGPS